METYVPPEHRRDAFHCPHCHTYASQEWFTLYGNTYGNYFIALPHPRSFLAVRCAYCQNLTVWIDGRLIHPITSTAPRPNPDLPDDVKADYVEAEQVAQLSPKSAGALLRLAIQKLCKHLGEPGKDINTDIASLVEKGLPRTVQQALDSVRVIGNNCVHPGKINVTEDPATVNTLFKLVNFVAHKMITEPKEIAEFYEALPQSQRDAIEKRDQS